MSDNTLKSPFTPLSKSFGSSIEFRPIGYDPFSRDNQVFVIPGENRALTADLMTLDQIEMLLPGEQEALRNIDAKIASIARDIVNEPMRAREIAGSLGAIIVLQDRAEFRVHTLLSEKDTRKQRDNDRKKLRGTVLEGETVLSGDLFDDTF